MAKRKAGVNDIIYELDNDDIVISSDEEGKDSKIGRFEGETSNKIKGKKQNVEGIHSDVINIDSACELACDITSPKKTQNGGKYIPKVTSIQNNANVQTNIKTTEKDVVININDENIDCQDTIIFHEDIAVDSPTSNTDLGVVGCENKAPLISVRFKDSFLAHNYKKRIKEFIVTLLKTQTVISAESETDNELEIWPEDLVVEEFDKFEKNTVEDNLFFVDTAPCDELHSDIPTYSQAKNMISNIVEKEPTPQTFRRGPICFNCEGSHPLKDCSLPRDNARINERRKAVTPRVGRYHVEDDQKYGHLVPGRISGDLRHALGLKRYELPLHVYRMRLLGYPPGWLEEARISHSGITLFDSSGTATLDPDEEEGEVCEPGSKDKFDIKKILDFPGFNVSASSRYIEEAELFGLPPMSDQDSKMAMLQILAPNAMKAYKRKKLSFFPSAPKNDTQEGQAEMELDSGDEAAVFPLVPPLPDDEPPPPPPPPPPPVEAEPNTQPNNHMEKDMGSKSSHHKTSDTKDNSPNQCSKEESNRKPEKDYTNKEATESGKDKKAGPIQETVDIDSDESSDDLEIIEVVRVNDIPMPEEDLIIIDDDDKSSLSSDRNSPTLDDLEERKQRLLDALKGDNVSVTDLSVENNESDEIIDKNSGENKTIEETGNLLEQVEVSNEENTKDVSNTENAIKEVSNKENVIKEVSNKENVIKEITNTENVIKEISNKENVIKGNETTLEENDSDKVESNLAKEQNIIDSEKSSATASNQTSSKTEPQMDNKTGKVRDTLYGTPVINVASPYSKLPSDDKFAKDICDVINFENLPNSIGKFKQISNLLKKVKTEVDRIHDS